MNKFEDHLLAELRAVHGADAARLPARERSRWARALTAGGAIVDVLDRRLMAQPGKAQPCAQPSFVAVGGFAIEQQTEPFGM